MLPGSILVDWCVGGGNRACIKLLSLPDEVLQKISFVFGEQKQLCLVDNLLEIRDKRTSFLGKLLRRTCQRLQRQKAVESDVDLLILECAGSVGYGSAWMAATPFRCSVTYRWHLAVLEGAHDTIDLKLAVNIGLPLLRI